ncbi:MAG: hypothetical protein MUE41_00150 [Gemmatimonadaceae bacterium]|jgi:hypothetical protein|nr:hypothetical protein [Gemmatimonadaceae bacterium]
MGAPFEPDDHDEQRAAVFVTTRDPIRITVGPLDDPRAPESSALGAFIEGRLIARSAMPSDAIERLLSLKLFDDPVPVGLLAFEEDPGLQCRLVALVPRQALQADEPNEPWKASVPSYEETAGASDETGGIDAQYQTILLGHIVRFARDRKHPDDLAAEAVDVLQKVLTGGSGELKDADAKAIDDLLDSL